MTAQSISFGWLLQFALKEGEDGLFLGWLQQHCALLSNKVDDLLRFESGEVALEDAVDAQLQDTEQLLPSVLQQRFLSVSDGDVDEEEEVLDGGLVHVLKAQELLPEEVQDGPVFFGWGAQEHQLYDGLAEVQAVEGLELPNQRAVRNDWIGLLLVLQPIQSAPHTYQQLLQETPAQLKSLHGRKLNHLLYVGQPLRDPPASQIPDAHLLHALLQPHHHLLRPLLALSPHQHALRHLCRKRRAHQLQLNQVVLPQGLRKCLVQFLEVVWGFDVANEGGKLPVDPSENELAVLRPFLDGLKQALAPQHSLGESKAEVVPAGHSRPGLIQGIADVPDEQRQIASLQSGHGLGVEGAEAMGGGEQVRQSRYGYEWKLAEEEALKGVVRTVELSFLLEAVAEQQVVPEPQGRIVELADAFGPRLLHVLLLDDRREDLPLQLGKRILILVLDLRRIEDYFCSDAQQAVYCISLVIFGWTVNAALGLVIFLAILIEVDPIDFQQFRPQAQQLLAYHWPHPLHLRLLGCLRQGFPSSLGLPLQVLLHHAMLHSLQHPQRLLPRALLLDHHAHLAGLLDEGQLAHLLEQAQVLPHFRTHRRLRLIGLFIFEMKVAAKWLIGLLCWAVVVQSFSYSLLRDSCNNYDNQNACRGQQTDNDASWSNRAFQTPPRGDPLWRESYQDYNILVGYVRSVYSAGGANLTVVTRVNPKYSSLALKYYFGETASDSNTFFVSNSFKGLLQVRVEAFDGSTRAAELQLDEVDFIWNHPAVNQPSNYKNGQKGAIIEMFGWPYDDIAEECEMIGKAGYLGVKVFPPSEAILDFEHPENGELNPWYWLYQPVSYKLQSRMGSPEQLRRMINTCRERGVRVYADAVVNHMVGNGNDMFPTHCSGGTYWGNKNSSAGSPFWTQGFAYESWRVTGQKPGMETPAVPYGPNDFHCARSLNSWTDGFILNYGWLVNLADLNTETEYVRQRIADYFTALLGMGFSGFRIDAAKHISPTNLAAIFAKFKANLGGRLPDDFITYLEVIIGGEKGLLMCEDNPYNFGSSFANLMRQQGLSDEDIAKVKIWESDYPKEFPLCGWPIPPERYAIQLDCHDDQFPGSSSRDMGDTGSVLVKEKNVDRHRNFNVQMFTRTDANWQIKLLLSSYTFMETLGAYGFPDGHSDCARCSTPECRQKCSKSMPYSKAHRSDVCGYTCVENGSWQQGVYTRVHRDFRTIKAVRQWMGLSTGVSPRDVGLPDNCS